MKTTSTYGIVASSKTRVYCIFCGVHIPKAARCIDQHLNGIKHKDNIHLMSENGIRFRSDLPFCKPCNAQLSIEESLYKHIEGEEHSTWMTAKDDLVDGEFISLESYLSSEAEEAFCEVCNAKFICTLQNIEEHVNALSHRLRIVERLKPLNGIFNVDTDEEVWCKVCDEYIDNTVESILQHIDDDVQHMEWFAEIEDLIEEQEVSLEQYLANEHENRVFCKKCQEQIVCKLEEIENHVHSVSHLSQFE